jgi:hypothetical protein
VLGVRFDRCRSRILVTRPIRQWTGKETSFFQTLQKIILKTKLMIFFVWNKVNPLYNEPDYILHNMLWLAEYIKFGEDDIGSHECRGTRLKARNEKNMKKPEQIAENSQVLNSTIERQTNSRTRPWTTRTNYWKMKCLVTAPARCTHAFSCNIRTIQRLRER